MSEEDFRDLGNLYFWFMASIKFGSISFSFRDGLARFEWRFSVSGLPCGYFRAVDKTKLTEIMSNEGPKAYCEEAVSSWKKSLQECNKR